MSATYFHSSDFEQLKKGYLTTDSLVFDTSIYLW